MVGVLRLDDEENELNNADYTLDEDAVSCWIAVDSISVHVIRTDEGVVVDLYPNKREYVEPLASTYAFFNEAETIEEDEDA